MWTEPQLDALRELANVGCGRAASALSELLNGSRVLSDLPRSRAAGPGVLNELLGAGAKASASEGLPVIPAGIDPGPLWIGWLSLGGDLSGDLICAMPERSAAELVGALHAAGSRQTRGAPGPGSLDGLSTFGEVANILGSAYLDGVSAFTGLAALPSPPRVERAPAAEADRTWRQQPPPHGVAGDATVALATAFDVHPGAVALPVGLSQMRGMIVLIPSPAAAAMLLAALRLSA